MRGDPSGSTETRFTNDDFRIIADVAHRASGITLPKTKFQFVYSRLNKRVRNLNLGCFREYCELLQSSQAEAELPNLISALTTNVTRFQREAHHTSHLREIVLPSLLKRAQRGDRIRLWSSACSTGEEAYEIAFQILDLCPNAASFDVKILATDIDPNALLIARTGEYSFDALESLHRNVIRKYFLPVAASDDRMIVGDGPRKLLTFRPLNLVRPWPVKGPFDTVFCRNVAIYFDVPTQDELWRRLAAIMVPGGVLYIGHSERILGTTALCFDHFGVTTFRRRAPIGGAAANATRTTKGSA